MDMMNLLITNVKREERFVTVLRVSTKRLILKLKFSLPLPYPKGRR